MNKPPSIGIIGCGFVGGAICEGFKHYTDVKVYDTAKDLGFEYKEVVNQEVLFVCLPTPMNSDGTVNTTILFDAVKLISDSLPEDADTPVLIKSTVPPGFCRHLDRVCPNLQIVFNPEFLTERTSKLDFLQQSRVILGSQSPVSGRVMDLFKFRFPGVRIVEMDWDEAVLVKYFTNIFFSIKVSIFNEFAQVTDALAFDPNRVAAEVLNDGRIARSHWQVPGHDGHKGFGGSCFPKDLNGYIDFAKKLGVNPVIAEAAWKKNLEVRPEQDWKELKGRAVSED